ncbi:MAG: lipoyl-dependent peroxiredoxin subunit [Candidatus Sumerlaeota bacterium]|nr:lipoyl-dependent peroxiredoxin subunit [Candidatus Sumerlaeota bacterium]
MIQIGQKAPEFECKALVGTEFKSIKLSDYKGKWVCLYFYPLDFTFVCPTEIKAFSDMVPEFEDRDCVVLGGSCDSEFSHLGWVNSKSELKDLKHPLISDYTKQISASLGILDAAKGVSHRATFLIDPEGIVRFIYVTDLNVGRSPDEVIRVLDALQTDELCPCNWKKGAETISV